jgi:hypothetical protein
MAVRSPSSAARLPSADPAATLLDAIQELQITKRTKGKAYLHSRRIATKNGNESAWDSLGTLPTGERSSSLCV